MRAAICVLPLAVIQLTIGTLAVAIPPEDGFEVGARQDEQNCYLTFADGVRCVINAPLSDSPRTVKRLLIVYATPNGNSLEQTWGCAPQDGRDWHFDIQHVAAQIRQLRQRHAGHNQWEFCLAIVQAPELSWPAYRAQHPDSAKRIDQMVRFIMRQVRADQLVLTGHSGGGAFILDTIVANADLPDYVSQILFLDANYSWDADLHAAKVVRWLQANPTRMLTVLAYDDRNIMLNGKKVVSETGGTYRATQRMRLSLQADRTLSELTDHGFKFIYDQNGQCQFAIHPNPENKILHTALVGEMNGLLSALELNLSPRDATRSSIPWPGLDSPRVYTRWVDQHPITPGAFVKNRLPNNPPGVKTVSGDPTQESIAEATRGKTALTVTLELPPRSLEAISGEQFADQMKHLAPNEAQALIIREFSAGNVPSHCRVLQPVEVEALDQSFKPHVGRYFVMPDVVAIGSDEDFVRVPIQPATAWQLANIAHASMITKKVSDDVHAAARWRLQPHPLTTDRERPETFWQHDRLIKQQLQDFAVQFDHAKAKDEQHIPDSPFRSQIVSGIKKDVVLSNRLLSKEHRVALYGWHYPDGVPIQPLYVGHVDHYVDYSHGVRLMADTMWVDHAPRTVNEILNDPDLCGLLSHEGPIDAEQIARRSRWIPQEGKSTGR